MPRQSIQDDDIPTGVELGVRNPSEDLFVVIAGLTQFPDGDHHFGSAERISCPEPIIQFLPRKSCRDFRRADHRTADGEYVRRRVADLHRIRFAANRPEARRSVR